MKASRRRGALVLLAAFATGLSFAGLEVAAADAELFLVRDGRPAATIVTAESPGENARVAALELQEYLEKISGAKLPVATDAAAPEGTLVLVGPRLLLLFWETWSPLRVATSSVDQAWEPLRTLICRCCLSAPLPLVIT